MRFIVLRFDGMLSFGAPAVGEVRPTDIFPACSMITGLIANALGYEHYERDKIQKLQQIIRIGTRVDNPGNRFMDYQTAAIKAKIGLWRSDKVPGNEDKTFDGTTLRYKYYLSDSEVTTVIGFDESSVPTIPSLDEIAHALTFPSRVLFIGRYCCIPNSPLFRGIFEAPSISSALSRIYPESIKSGSIGEWPAATAGKEEIKEGIIIERQDLRDWMNDIHSGSRLVWRGPIKG